VQRSLTMDIGSRTLDNVGTLTVRKDQVFSVDSGNFIYLGRSQIPSRAGPATSRAFSDSPRRHYSKSATLILDGPDPRSFTSRMAMPWPI